MRAQLVSWLELAPGVRHFVFEVPDVESFPFEPGQFVSLSAEVGGKKVTRAYSLAGVPRGNRFELCLNLVEDGHFSPLLFGLRRGDAVEFRGPLGYFVWRKPVSDSILVATGTGIAPIRGMPAQYLIGGGTASLTLVFGVRYAPSLYYRDEFENYQLAHGNFRFWPVLSRGEDEWSGRRGHVQEHVMEALEGRLDKDIYICGLKAMVDDLRSRLKAAGVDRKRIIYEKFD